MRARISCAPRGMARPGLSLWVMRQIQSVRQRLAGVGPGCDHHDITRRRRMEIKASGSVPTRRQPKESFTGTVWQDPIIEAPAPARIRAGRVSFEPGARTAWHTHPLGQTLHVISGVGRVQAKGGPVREIKAGDTVWIPPNEKHWHGAGPNTGMIHIAMQESLDGKHVEWMEYVSDEEYSQSVG
jgi:quercetin dioxygenase-like cupin family protein